ncbi:DNA-binding transcriptional LysR family regulator [Nonomuraea muscovyensis]|uniref:DNA-binding transcriptional LysR family regulator n=1 Tax=Nonomuraea muscovyensis TaxID=1124761 RepID=A0A7X0C585_9ACTN|nr:LysR family transcriptional regulator [Nonomuraea muscovyensis]MBB6348745.1 DNA-binding transcriptional LysR family regulator [Nonomuraea muscovyensis]
MDVRRLQMLLQLSRLGSMREVADELGTTTSTVSQQIAALAREAGTALVEPDGRRVRLTPAGRRLAQHAVTILAAVEAARLDLDPEAEPAGTLRVAGFASAVRRSLLPVAADLAAGHPKVRLHIYEHEPMESLALLASDDVDLALTYDYNLAPAAGDPAVESRPLWSTGWSLAVPRTVPAARDDAPAVFAIFRDHDWIANSRSTADEHVVRTIASMAGFEPRIAHRADSLELVQDLIVAGLGVGLLPTDQPTLPGIRLLPLAAPEVRLRSYAVVRRGRAQWPPLALVLDLLAARAASTGTM